VTLVAGTRLGSYEIVGPLGAGGMGEVYRAKDSKLKREVAVKVLPETLARDADALARFEREALAVAALSHPNILAIHDFGTESGTVYAVTELLEGETLRGRIDGSSISQTQAIDWCLQIAKGLSAAHGKGVVHRDLKPDNVFVSKDGHVKILDFGLAKREEAATSEQTNAPTGSGHTAPGTVMGTMGYMSPEQLRGLPVDHRSDIFSFGAILYELLSGKKAFKRDTATDTIVAVLKEEPPELTQTGRNVSPALDHIVRHCLEKDRDNRFQSAKDVAFALSEASSPTTAVTSGVQAVVVESERKRRNALIAAAVLIALIAAGLLLWKRPRTGAAASGGGAVRVAVLPFENLGAPEDDYFADGIADEVRGKLTSVPGVQVIARSSSTPYKKTNKTPKQIAQELNATYLLTATVRWQKGDGANRVHVSPELVDVTDRDAPTSKWQQRFDANITDVFQVQSEIATKVAQALGVALGAGEQKRLSERPTENLEAYHSFLKGEVIDGADPSSLRKALKFYEQALALDPSFAQAWAGVSLSAALIYTNSTPTIEMSNRAREAADKAVALGPDYPQSYQALGGYYRLVVGDNARALEAYEKGLRLAPNNASLLRGAAFSEQALGRWDASLEHCQKAVRIDPQNPGTALGWTLLSLRRYREARESVDQALVFRPANLTLIEHKAMTFLGEGDLGGARATLDAVPREVEPTALAAYLAYYYDLAWVLDDAKRDLVLRLTPDAFDGDRGVWALALMQAFALKGDATNVRVHAEEARKESEAQLRDVPNDAGRHANMGLALAYLGRKEEAIRESRRAVELVPIAKDAVTGTYWVHQLVRVYILVGEHEKAIDELEKVLKVPYYLSPAWLKIDPNFDPLRSNPRFQKLVAGGK
jgi:eukaryotic-like serine/threonine-protein kinase